MSSFTLSEINIYPVKSLGGISVASANITDRGLQHDRRWLLTNENNKFITQREFPKMALMKIRLSENGFEIFHPAKNNSFKIPFSINETTVEKVTVFDDVCAAANFSNEANDFFSEALESKCKFFFMADNSKRMVDKKYAQQNEIVNFADAFPFLIIGQSSLDDLNKRLQQPIPMNRFRPNFVFTGGNPFEEDLFDQFKIGDAEFRAVKPCARCVIPTIDQDTAVKSKEPSATLATYRSFNNKICFGQNLLCNSSSGKINVGDELTVLSRKENFYNC